jgi:Fic family protein
MPSLVHAGLAHLYFELIHPFEDGNGRIGRAIAEKALAMGAKHPLITSLSSTLERNKKAYYQALANANGSLDVTEWLVYFSEEVMKAQSQVQKLILFIVEKARYFENFREKLNDRQSKVALRLFREGPEGFKGGLSAANYMRICTTSSATATRDLAEMVDLRALKKTGKLRHTRYYLPMVEIFE